MVLVFNQYFVKIKNSLPKPEFVEFRLKPVRYKIWSSAEVQLEKMVQVTVRAGRGFSGDTGRLSGSAAHFHFKHRALPYLTAHIN